MYGVKQQDLHKFITDNNLNLNLNTLQANSLAPPELFSYTRAPIKELDAAFSVSC